jgi:hypothetical protein
LRAASCELEDNPGRHLGEEELIAYQQGRLDADEREKSQSHLVRCSVCRDAFRDLTDFFEPAREGEEVISEAEIRREWKALRRRIWPEEKPADRASGLGLAGLLRWPRTAFALAAALVLAITMTGAWALWLRQEKQQLARQLQTEQSAWAERLKQLEQENRGLQEQVGAAKQNYEAQLAELRRPLLNAPIYDVYSQQSIQRSGGDSKGNPVKVPQKARRFTLILNGEGQSQYPDYVIEIIDPKGQSVLKEGGLIRDSLGNFSIELDRASMSAGKYRLKLYGQTDKRSQEMAEYVVWLTMLP